MAVVAVALLHPQAAQRLEPRVPQAHRPPGLHQPVVHVNGLLGRDVQLVAELAQVGDPDAEHPREPDVDLGRPAERERLVGHVNRGDAGQQFPRPRALDVDLRVARRHVRDEGVRVADVAAQPGFRVPVRGVGGDHPEPVVGELGHREVGLQRAAGVEPLRIGDPAGLAVHMVG